MRKQFKLALEPSPDSMHQDNTHPAVNPSDWQRGVLQLQSAKEHPHENANYESISDRFYHFNQNLVVTRIFRNQLSSKSGSLTEELIDFTRISV